MGKIFVLSVTDHEEYVLSRIIVFCISVKIAFILNSGLSGNQIHRLL